MKLPKTVDVMGKPYSVTFDPNLMDDGTGSGLCKSWRCEIRIAKDMAEPQVRDTLLHEVMHGIFSETGLTTEFKEDDDEEKIVRRMATGLLQVLRANPKFIDILLEP